MVAATLAAIQYNTNKLNKIHFVIRSKQIPKREPVIWTKLQLSGNDQLYWKSNKKTKKMYLVSLILNIFLVACSRKTNTNNESQSYECVHTFLLFTYSQDVISFFHNPSQFDSTLCISAFSLWRMDNPCVPTSLVLCSNTGDSYNLWGNTYPFAVLCRSYQSS